MPIGSSLGISLPTQGGNTGTWGSDLNTEIAKIVTAVEAQVPASAIDFSADFDLNGNGLTSVKMAAFTQQASVTTLNSLYFNTDGDVYARDGGNNIIQLTASGVLNTASNGGITDSSGGGVSAYGQGGIAFDWDGTQYNALSGTGVYAPIRASTLLLHDNSGHQVTVDCPSISASYALTLPTAQAAGATTILQSDTAGNLSYSNSFSTDITFTGTAKVKHANRDLVYSTIPGLPENGAANWNFFTSTGARHTASGGDTLVVPIAVPAGIRIRQIDAQVSVANTNSRDLELLRGDIFAQGVPILVASASSIVNGEYTHSITAIDHTVVASDTYWVKWTTPTGSTANNWKSIKVVYDIP